LPYDAIWMVSQSSRAALLKVNLGVKRALMAHGPAFDQMTNLFGEVLGVVAGAFQSLGHEEDFEAQGDIAGFPAHLAGVDAGAEGVHFAVKTMSGKGRAHVALSVSLMHQR